MSAAFRVVIDKENRRRSFAAQDCPPAPCLGPKGFSTATSPRLVPDAPYHSKSHR